MKVFLLNGSPHENGSTATALEEISHVFHYEGVETELISIGKKTIRGCTACGACKAGNKKCVFDDDLVNICIDKLRQADGLIIGSPVYYSSANGTLISLLDRMFCAGSAEGFAYKPAAAIACARRTGNIAAIDQMNHYFTIAQMPVISSSYWNVAFGAVSDDVKKDLEGMQTMRNLARNMAWLMKCIEAGRQNGISLPQNEYHERTNFIR